MYVLSEKLLRILFGSVETKELQQHVYEGIWARPYIKGNVQLPADVGMIMVLRKGPYTVVPT
jgi:hypothetical protein